MRPHLTSLFAMLQLNASDFVEVFSALSYLEGVEISGNQGAKATPEDLIGYGDLLTKLAEHLETLGCIQTMKGVERLEETLQEPNLTLGQIREGLQRIRERLVDELSTPQLLVIDPKKADYFDPESPLFGEVVDSLYPSAAFEIQEAGKCMALERSTASACHLMRATEVGLTATRRYLGIPEPTKDAHRNWGIVVAQIEHAISERKKNNAWKDSDERSVLESAHGSLVSIKNAWRNSTMHCDNKYTYEEAEEIFVCVRGFMRKIASRFDEDGAEV